MRALLRSVAGALACLAIVFGLGRPASAVIEIKITSDVEGALPIAIIPFAWSGTGQYPPQRIAEIVSENLGRSGRFAPLSALDLPGRPTEESEIRWADWERLGIGNLVIGRLRQDTAGGPAARYTVEYRLFDVFKRERISALADQVPGGELRKTAHQISDLVYEALTGERGAFDTQIAYVTETGDLSGSRYYALNVADSDGHSEFLVTQSSYPIMSPAWSNDGRRLAYVSFEGNRAAIYIRDLGAGTQSKVSSYPGINGAPAWSPDDARLALTLSKDGNPEIYVLHLASGILRRITDNVAIDTEPAWSPDGRAIVFTSDRGGRPQVYRVAVDGGRAERLTFEGVYNARPAFTPDGKSIALVHGKDRSYRIALLSLETGYLNVLTDSQLDESPTVAPNGKMILYATTERGRATLAAVSVDGRVRHIIGIDVGGVRDPAWSPFLTRR